MTREEAKREILFAKREVVADSWIDKAYDVAIKALSEPERKHGYWRYAEFLYAFICSNCGRSAISCYDYCPCCGAEMRMKDEN